VPAIGITGGVASGKSTLTSRLAERLGADVFDSDHFVHELLRNSPETMTEVEKRFGREVMTEDGMVDRVKLGTVVFADPAQRRSLEAIVHPRVREGWRDAMSAPTASRFWWVAVDPSNSIDWNDAGGSGANEPFEWLTRRWKCRKRSSAPPM